MIRRLHGEEEMARVSAVIPNFYFCTPALAHSNTFQEDFQKAADLGSPFAKMQVVAFNPYAAMCNKMLSEVFSDLHKGKLEEQQ